MSIEEGKHCSMRKKYLKKLPQSSGLHSDCHHHDRRFSRAMPDIHRWNLIFPSLSLGPAKTSRTASVIRTIVFHSFIAENLEKDPDLL
jgi:hypothetical protein